MRQSLALLALAATAFAMPQAVTDDISPPKGPPEECSTSYSGQFEVTIFKPSNNKRDLSEVSPERIDKNISTDFIEALM